MKINEIFKSIQGEGKYTGHPVLFIRTSGCTRQCSFCDTQYHKNGKEMSVKKIIKAIKDSGMDIVVWTGGEPMLQYDEIKEVIEALNLDYTHHLESNGDIIVPLEENSVLGMCSQSESIFDYLSISPKCLIAAKNAKNLLTGSRESYDIKVVTDLTRNKELIPYATTLMPLSTYDEKKDKQIQRNVWEYCVEHKLKYAHRVHVNVWGKSIGK